MRRTLRALAPLLLAAPLYAAPTAPSAPVAKSTSAVAVVAEGRFSVRTPKGWSASRDEREDARQKTYGVLLSGPRSADGVLATIDVAYYPPDNVLFKGGATEFLKRNLEPDPRFVAPAGESTTPLKKTVVAGAPAQTFTRRTHVVLPPDRMDGISIAVVEEVYVVSAKSGFYIVDFKTAKSDAARTKPSFKRALSSLKFLPAPAP